MSAISRTVAILALSVATATACFGDRHATAAPPSTEGLAGTAWRLVRFEGGDDRTLIPDDRSKYTLEFKADGNVAVRLDCNRGFASWKSPEPSRVDLGPLALTRAMCPPGSLHDQIARQWPYIRTYVIRDEHLFLSLMADGGTYELEPMDRKSKPQTAEGSVAR